MTQEQTTAPSRLLSLDVFRGITIAGMVLVNNPGSWSAIYPPLEHSAWHGLTPTDLIFPFFLFIVGISITFALGKKVEDGKINRAVYLKIIKRTLLIFGIGLLLNAFPFYNFISGEWLDLSTLRIMGVLQRIAVCYFFVSLIFIHTGWKQQLSIGIILLFVYWALLTLINVPGCEITTFNDKACNLAAYLDRSILTENHIWDGAKVYDPEGILSTLPAIVTALAGVLCGRWLQQRRDDNEKVAALFFFGVTLLAIGWAWNFWFPINKALWTSSYVVFTAGFALCFLGFCYWLVDLKGYRKWAKPFVIFGVNAIALYIGSWIMAVFLDLIPAAENDGVNISLKDAVYNALLAVASPENASLIFAVCFILIWLFLMWLLYRKRIFIKI